MSGMNTPLALALVALAEVIEEDHVAYEGVAFEVENSLTDSVLASLVDDLYGLLCNGETICSVKAEALRMARELAPSYLLEKQWN
jgi:hypothetical protein